MRFIKLAISALILTGFGQTANAGWKWQYEREFHPMTDEDQSLAFYRELGSQVTKEMEIILPATDGEIYVRCNSSSDYDIFFATDRDIPLTSQRVPGPMRYDVKYRVDDGQPTEFRKWWSDTDQHHTVFAPESIKRDLVASLKQGSEISFQVVDASNQDRFVTFSLAGSAAALRKLTCLD